MRNVENADVLKLEDLRILLMAILRLNDGKHFIAGNAESKKERVYGHINSEGKLNLHEEECKIIKKIFEPLYSNHL